MPQAYLFFPRPSGRGFKVKVKMEIKEIKELMFKAFKEGQKRFKADDMPIKLWIAGVLDDSTK